MTLFMVVPSPRVCMGGYVLGRCVWVFLAVVEQKHHVYIPFIHQAWP